MSIRRRLKLNSGTSATVAAALAFALPVPAQAQQQTFAFDIPASNLSDALGRFGRTTRRQLVYNGAQARQARTAGVRGTMSAEEALSRLVEGTGFSSRIGSAGVMIVERSGSGEGEAGGAAADDGSADADQAGVAEILVIGSRSQNVDIRRTEDDAQPYVVFDREEIERSQTRNLESFFRTRVPQNTSARLASEGADARGQGSSNISAIDLRGLGADETLILVDGRRAPRLLSNGQLPTQADVNGIPIESIERIEILPSTAGGIYGGGATGGVINIVRRRDYHGITARIGVDGTFRGGGETLRADLTGGFSFNRGRTQIGFAASRAATRPIYVGDNDLWRAGRELYAANDTLGGLIVGNLVNIRSQNGTNLVFDARYGGGALGANRLYLPQGYRGVALDGTAPLVATAGRFDLALPDDETGRRSRLVNNPRVTTANVNIRHALTRTVDLFADFGFSDNYGRFVSPAVGPGVTLAADAPANPFQQAISIGFARPGVAQPIENHMRSLSATGGAIVRLGGDWTANAEYSWSQSRSRTTYTSVPLRAIAADVASGVLDVFRDLSSFPLDLAPYRLQGPDSSAGPFILSQEVASLRASGSLLRLPGGPLNMTLLAEHRNDAAAEAMVRSAQAGSVTTYPARSQSVTSGYAELRIPIVGRGNATTLIQALELQASVRHDRYSTRASDPLSYSFPLAGGVPPAISYDRTRISSTNYTLAATWTPVAGISLRGSYATGFLPPAISQLTATPTPGPVAATIIDPKRGNERLGLSVPYTVLSGGRPDLQPETSRGYSFGVILTPRFLPGFRFSADYNRIRKTNEIRGLSLTGVIADEALYPGRIVRGPRLPTDPVGWEGPITLVDASLANISRTDVEAIDFRADYRADLGAAGNLSLYGLATRQLTFRQKLLPTTALFDTAGFFDGPLRWRGNVGADWTLGGWSASWNAQYYDSYSLRYGNPSSASSGNNNVVLQGGVERIPSQIYHDLVFGYRFGPQAPALLAGTQLSIGIQNVFDTAPPVVANLIAGYSPYGDPRLRRYSLSLRRTF